jgi:hypothetical protein
MPVFNSKVREDFRLSIGNRASARTILDAIEFAVAHSTGSVFYVDSATGKNGPEGGKSPLAPVATVDYAVGLCTASKGDVIVVMPGHAENLTTATSINCDVAGITIIGLGEGNLRPTFSTTAAAGACTVAAANVTLANLKFVANFATGTTTGLTLSAAADGCTLDGIVMRDTSTANEFLVHISVATTVTDLTIRNCSLIGLTGGSMTNSILFAGTTSNTLIENCDIQVDSSDSVIDHLAAAATNLALKHNFIINADTDTEGYVIDCHADATGFAAYNGGGYNKVDAEMTKGAKMFWVENYFSNTIAESGLLEPATSHAIP